MADVALAYDTQQRSLTEAAVNLLGSALTRAVTPSGWRDGVADIGEDLLTLQVASAALADDYLDAVLTAQAASLTADAAVNPQAWADTTDGGGSWLRYLIFAPLSVQETAVQSGISPEAALAQMQTVASSIVVTGLRDTARSSVQAGMQARRSVRTYVRMLRPPSCARCAVLAGKKSNRQTAFRRHRHCDCVNVPSAENAGDWTTDPRTYFRSLDEAEQDRVFTKAGAHAIRLGADVAQVVNARQGITTVTSNGFQLATTTVGTTPRGLAGSRLNGSPRLLPDEIFLQAERLGWDRAEMLRQLRRFAYLL